MKILANGFLMAYSDTLVGSPLLFIHGFPLNRQMWAPQITALSSDARIIAPDLRGHGESPRSMDLTIWIYWLQIFILY